MIMSRIASSLLLVSSCNSSVGTSVLRAPGRDEQFTFQVADLE
jgi:hypothetical protein